MLIGLWAVAAGCAGSPAPSATPTPLPPETDAPPISGLPPGCQPISLLNATTGDRIDLDGVWVQVVQEGAARMTWWIRTQGDCLWGSGSADLATIPNPIQWDVQTLRGRITTAFTIEGEIVQVGPKGSEEPQYYADARFFIEFDDAGGVSLREDREPGVEGPRCPAPGAFCPDPLVLVPLAD